MEISQSLSWKSHNHFHGNLTITFIDLTIAVPHFIDSNDSQVVNTPCVTLLLAAAYGPNLVHPLCQIDSVLTA
jgi:hypothetical protein